MWLSFLLLPKSAKWWLSPLSPPENLVSIWSCYCLKLVQLVKVASHKLLLFSSVIDGFTTTKLALCESDNNGFNIVSRCLRCDRVTVHVHLMIALTLRCILLVVITEPFIFHRTNHYRNVVRVFYQLFPISLTFWLFFSALITTPFYK